jgi:hypothetical protein
VLAVHKEMIATRTVIAQLVQRIVAENHDTVFEDLT